MVLGFVAVPDMLFPRLYWCCWWMDNRDAHNCPFWHNVHSEHRDFRDATMSTLFPTSWSGPDLPPFRTFLVKGSYHPSAPIHLCLSHTCTRPHSRTLLLTPSRSNFIRSLAEFNDDWLSTHSGHGKLVELSSGIEIV